MLDATVIYIAPLGVSSGVGDYADDVLRELRPQVREIVEIRHAGAGQTSAREVVAIRRRVRELIARAPGEVVIHTDLSGGALPPFWSLAGARGAARTATVHDAPLGVWTPLRTRLIGRSRIVAHLVHFPFLPIHRALERRVLRDVRLVVLTPSGAEATARELRHADVTASFLPVPPRPEVLPATERPMAVGLFGYVYKGKGYDHLDELRAALDPAIELRIAGRGTEALPPRPGIAILGAVEGADEDAFFAGIRALLVPYGRRSSYGPETHVASASISHALAYLTPSIAIRHAGISVEAQIVDGTPTDLAEAAGAFVQDPARMDAELHRIRDLRAQRTTMRAADTLIALWRGALDVGIPPAVSPHGNRARASSNSSATSA